MEGDLTLGGECTIQSTDDVLWNRTTVTYIILLTNDTPINSMKNKNKLNFENNLNATIP